MTPASADRETGETATKGAAPKRFVICVNRRFGSDRPACGSRGSGDLAEAIENGVALRGIDVTVERIVCFGMCRTGPNMRLVPGGDFHKNVGADQIDGILDMLWETCGLREESEDIPSIPGS